MNKIHLFIVFIFLGNHIYAVKKGPDFLLIGAMKSGTSSLYKCICEHPKIHRAASKELHFFETEKYKTLGLDWYLSQFPEVKDNEITGEGSVSYIYESKVPKRVKKYFPNIKLILILRNPVDRIYSHYQHRVLRMGERRKFDELIMSVLKKKISINLGWPIYNEKKLDIGERLLRRGIYIKQIEYWLKYFSPSQLHVVIFDDFVCNPLGCLQDIYEFLGVNFNDKISPGQHKNTIRYPKMKSNIRKKLISFYKPFNRKLEKFLDKKLNWEQ